MADWTALSDYFLIGDLHTAALVSSQGSIDWLCLPRFDSPSVFARILDRKAGCLALDHDDAGCLARYVPDTAIVETIVETSDAQFRLRDFMVPQPRRRCDANVLVRKIVNDGPETTVHLCIHARPDYGRREGHFQRRDDLLIEELDDGQLKVHVPRDATLNERDGAWHVAIPLARNAQAQIVLEFQHNCDHDCMPEEDKEPRVREFWKQWVEQGTYVDFCRDRLVRSAITLKLMQYYPTGAIIAAPTTSLPEGIGGVRNWDYRYVWVRDATFTIYALYVLGHYDEAKRFFDFLERTALEEGGDFRGLHLMYTIDGRPVPDEQTLDHLEGYRGSKPVRIGNGAMDQFQLDAYGSLIDAYFFMSKRHIELDDEARMLILGLVKQIAEQWRTTDHGIWEVRSETRHYTYSKVMAWVGVNRAIRLADRLNIDKATLQQWKDLETEIKDWIWDHCYDAERQVFRQHSETHHQDASTLLLVLLQFLHKHDELTATIIDNTCQALTRDGDNDIFVYRYFSDDGLPGEEGAFLLCSFWMISAIAILEQVDRASELFERLEAHLADSGLISEEIDIATGEYLGNHPQAFSHMGYIMSAHYIARYRARQQQRRKQAAKKL